MMKALEIKLSFPTQLHVKRENHAPSLEEALEHASSPLPAPFEHHQPISGSFPTEPSGLAALALLSAAEQSNADSQACRCLQMQTRHRDPCNLRDAKLCLCKTAEL